MQEDLCWRNEKNAEGQTQQKQAMKEGNPKNGIAVHAHETQHKINWNGAEVKKMEANYWKRRTFEAIQIKASTTPSSSHHPQLQLPQPH